MNRYEEERAEAFKINMESRIDEDYESLPEECKRCKFLSRFNSCTLSNSDFTDDCPLESMSCEKCKWCYRLVGNDDEELDMWYCYWLEKTRDKDCSACTEYEEYKE